jgi:CO/xanthine dehydrogenase Mo-binding subunit
VVRPPRPGSKLDSVDEAAAKALPGVIAVVRDGSFLGVVAEREEQAIKARAALAGSAKWTLGPPLPDPAKLYDHLLSLPAEATVVSEKQPAALAAAAAPLASAAPSATKVLEATYHKPYTAHGSIGPSCALAELKDGKLTVWTHSQGVFPNRAHLARAATATTAPTTSRSTRRCWRAALPGGRCGCSGCATTNSAGNPTVPPW